MRQLESTTLAHQASTVAAPEALPRLLREPLLSVDPACELPAFFSADALTAPCLRSGAALPPSAIGHVGQMLAASTIAKPYPGIAIVKAACTSASLAQFAWDLFEAWLAAGAPGKESWTLTALALLGDDAAARRLAPMIREWPGESAQQHALLGLEVLAAMGSEVALMHLSGIAAKARFRALQDHACEQLQLIATARGLSAEQLADRAIPDFGLDANGSLWLDFGPRRFQVGFDETLRPFLTDERGAHLESLPKPLKSDDALRAPAAMLRYKQLKQDSKAIASIQLIRLELAMVRRRRWSAAEFRQYLLEHPLLRHLTARLLWGVYEAGTLHAAFRVAEDWTLAGLDDALYSLADTASVGLVHPLELTASQRLAFRQVFTDYEVLQPFKQLDREVCTATTEELQATSITRFNGEQVATGSIMGLVNRGWERGAAEHGGPICDFSKRLGEYEVELQLDPGIILGDVRAEPTQRLLALHLRRCAAGKEVPFAQLDPIALSEVLRDIELLARIE